MEYRPELVPGDAHDAALLEEVHPSDWAAPPPRPRYDLVVLGGGTAGLVAAMGAAGLGAVVALVERRLLGGDCLVTGCVPSKALLRSARAAAEAREAGSRGVRIGRVEPDLRAALTRMRRLRAEIAPHDSARRLREAGVDVFLGEGRFTGPDRLEVDGSELSFRRALVATGGRPTLPPIPGIDGVGVLTSESLFALEQPPARLAVLGGGPIGCEMAQAFARLGVDVVLLERGDRLLSKEDEEAAAVIERALRRDGVDVRLGASVVAASSVAGGCRLELEGGSHVLADRLLAATGRAPRVEGIGLEAAGVRFDARRGVEVDTALRTSNRRIHASGDCCSAFQFTHAADRMSRIALRNALFPGPRQRFSDVVMPWVTYTTPEVAHVGLTEAEAAQRDDVRAFTTPLSGLDRAVLDGETEGYARAWVDRKGRVLGATFVGTHAGESIAEMTLAAQQGLRLDALSDTVHPYPTQAEVWRQLGDAYARTRLTPFVARLLRWWLRFRRNA